jgi:hypothetical protein
VVAAATGAGVGADGAEADGAEADGAEADGAEAGADGEFITLQSRTSYPATQLPSYPANSIS